jgi:hypothetical protein
MYIIRDLNCRLDICYFTTSSKVIKLWEDRGQGEGREDSLEQRGETKSKIRSKSTDSESYRETQREAKRIAKEAKQFKLVTI